MPTYDRMKRYQGQWHVEQGIAFPDIIFLESEDPETLEQELHDKCPDSRMIRLSSEQKGLFAQLFGEEKHMPLSKGHIRQGQTCVTHLRATSSSAPASSSRLKFNSSLLRAPMRHGTST